MKKSKLKLILTLLLLINISSCAVLPILDQFERMQRTPLKEELEIDVWLHRNISELLQYMPKFHSFDTYPNGNRIYNWTDEYLSADFHCLYSYDYTNGEISTCPSITNICAIYAYVDSNNLITFMEITDNYQTCPE